MSEIDYNSQLEEVKSEAKKYRIARKKALEELAEVKAQLEEQTKLLNKYQQEPNELKLELDKARSEIRTRDHKEVFKRVAAEKKIRPEALDDVWNLSKYQALEEAPDEAQIGSTIDATLQARPYLLEQPQPQKLQPGPGAARGAETRNESGFTIKRSELGKVLVGPHAKQYLDAYKAKTVNIVDD